MALLSAEAVLVSALINNQDIGAAARFGLRPEHMEGYKEELNWLLNYVQTYDSEPSRDAFRVAFPNFVFSEHEDVRSAADLVFKKYNQRKLAEVMSTCVEYSSMGDIQAAYQLINSARPLSTSSRPRPLLTDLDFLDTWGDHVVTVPVPYKSLQDATGGIRPGNLWYLAARPSQGKTAHLVNMVKHAVLNGTRVMFYSLEMSEDEVRQRFHAAMAQELNYPDVTVQSLRQHRVDKYRYKELIQDIDNRLLANGGLLDLHTPKDGPVTPGLVASRAADYHLNVVDYIGLMKTDGGQASIEDWRVAAAISNELKLIAEANQTGILSAAQINREGATGQSPPKLVHLSQSDALAQDGDVVLTLRARPHNVASHFSIEKNRHGVSGLHFHTMFDVNTGTFSEIGSDAADDLVERMEAAL